MKFCLVTNECTTPKKELAKKLNSFGFSQVDESHIVSPAPIACSYLVEKNLVPRLHVYEKILDDFKPIIDRLKDKNKAPNCLVIGDVMEMLSRDFIDESLELMLNCHETPKIISMGAGRYYKDGGRLRMDTGAYTKAFEYCLGVNALNIGKPSKDFFDAALNLVDGTVEDTVMIGDDIISDVGGAQEMGMRGFLVRTGKYKLSDEFESHVKPDHVFDDMAEAIQEICMMRR